MQVRVCGYKVATLLTPSAFTRPMKAHRGVVIGWTGPTGGLALGAIDFACRNFSWLRLLGIGG